MDYSASFSGKRVQVNLTPAAIQALAKRDTPLLVEMELYFSCLIRKQVRFSEAGLDTIGERVTDKLYLDFTPVMTQHCGKDYTGDEPPLTAFPIENPAAFIPKWLSVDYRRGEWRGEFSY